ncbi:hypothetical protein MRX96_045766 [Rhipicephalus microplus]
MSKGIEVTFEETQHREDLPPRVVLALDVSDRMNGDDRMTFLKEAATRYVRDIADGSKSLGIITFSSTAAGTPPADASECFYPAELLECGERFESGWRYVHWLRPPINPPDETPQGGIILLMSDGEENMKPKVNDVLPELMAAKDGEWTIRLESASLQEVEVNIQVKSQARDPNDKPIRVKSEMAVLQVAKPDDAVILTEINKGYKVILDARVVAEVIGPNSPHKSTVPLHDDGLG